MRNGKKKFLIDHSTIAYDVNGLEQYDSILDNGVRMIFFFFKLVSPPPHSTLNVENLILQNIK